MGNGNSRPLSKEEILQKALAAKERLAYLKAQSLHKHALQGKVIQKPKSSKKSTTPSSSKAGEKAKKDLAAASMPASGDKKRLEQKKAERRKQSDDTPVSAKKLAGLQKALTPGKAIKSGKGATILPKEHKANVASLSKEKQKSIVKQILQKAKGLNRPPAAAKSAVPGGDTQTPKPQRVTHTFVLPQFSRSRRAIIPNKRFIEDDPIPSAVLVKKSRIETEHATIAELLKAPSANGVAVPVPSSVTPSPSSLPSSSSTNKKFAKAGAPGLAKTTPSSSAHPSNTRDRKSSAKAVTSASTPKVSATAKTPAYKQTTPQTPALLQPRHPGAKTPTPKTVKKDVAAPSSLSSSSSSTPKLLPPFPELTVTAERVEVRGDGSVEVRGDGSVEAGLLMTAESLAARTALLDQPLIREGKRQRVPSLKVGAVNSFPVVQL
jgi:hypothetical protein